MLFWTNRLQIIFLIINSQGQIHQHVQAAFSCKQDEELFWQMAFGEWRINLANLMLHIG